MGLDFSNLKKSVISKIKRKIGEFALPPEQQGLIRRLFSRTEQDQLDAACSLGKAPDAQVLCLLQFYLQDSFLDDLIAGLPGREFRLDLAEKKAIKFYARMAASMMLSDSQFFSYVLQMICSKAVEAEERCDLVSVVGAVFETFGEETKDTGLGQGAWVEYAWATLAVMASPEEQEEVKVACAMALKKTLRNPNINADAEPNLAKAASERLAAYGEVLAGA